LADRWRDLAQPASVAGQADAPLAPEALEPVWRQLGVAHRMLDIPVTEPSLQRPRVVAGIGQREAAGVAQHVRVNRERHVGALAEALDQVQKLLGVNGPPRSEANT